MKKSILQIYQEVFMIAFADFISFRRLTTWGWVVLSLPLLVWNIFVVILSILSCIILGSLSVAVHIGEHCGSDRFQHQLKSLFFKS
ncbi:MAG: hypothetical protein Q8K92_26660 [Leadbetterella sp.]|nr:hypothetical protein [Leadbetterella sp.]